MRVLFAIVMVLALTGASCQHRNEAPVGDAPAMCYLPCTPSLTDTGIRWTSDPEDPDAMDELGEVVVPKLAEQSLTCEARRQACADFLQSLKRRGVYRGTEQ
ncbi:MAG TPA: hypothetical protein VGE09_06565 [Pseudoxanthomonas sp.]